MQLAETTIFIDSKGREWDCKLTLASARRIDNSDLSNVGIPEDFSILKPTREFFTTMLTDAGVTFAMVWAIVSPQAKKYEGFPDPTTDYDAAELEFIEGLDGEAIERGQSAFWRAISDFFPKHRTVLLTLMRKYAEAHQRIAEGVSKMDQQISKVLDATVSKELAELEEKMNMLNPHGET